MSIACLPLPPSPVPRIKICISSLEAGAGYQHAPLASRTAFRPSAQAPRTDYGDGIRDGDGCRHELRYEHVARGACGGGGSGRQQLAENSYGNALERATSNPVNRRESSSSCRVRAVHSRCGLWQGAITYLWYPYHLLASVQCTDRLQVDAMRRDMTRRTQWRQACRSTQCARSDQFDQNAMRTGDGGE